MLNTIYNVLWHRLQALVISSLARTNIVISSTYIVTHRDTSWTGLACWRSIFNMFKIVGDILRQRDVAVLCSRYIVLSTCCSCCALDDLAERFSLRGIIRFHSNYLFLTLWCHWMQLPNSVLFRRSLLKQYIDFSWAIIAWIHSFSFGIII